MTCNSWGAGYTSTDYGSCQDCLYARGYCTPCKNWKPGKSWLIQAGLVIRFSVGGLNSWTLRTLHVSAKIRSECGCQMEWFIYGDEYESMKPQGGLWSRWVPE